MRSPLLVLLLVLGGACATPSGNESPGSPSAGQQDEQADECCAQCRTAANRDPQGRNLDLVPCLDYGGATVNGAPALSKHCTGWFLTHPTFVQDCR